VEILVMQEDLLDHIQVARGGWRCYQEMAQSFYAVFAGDYLALLHPGQLEPKAGLAAQVRRDDDCS
jgi:hypothetical protein